MMKKKTVLVGMSGGVDSAMAAFLLKEDGYKVRGVTLELYDHERGSQLQNIISHLDIEHCFVDVRNEFRNIVIEYFIDEYKKGRTPSPCYYCNENIKFPVLLKLAESLDAEYIATGHYVNKEFINDKFYITRGTDKKKDQSYYLWKINQETLQKTLFPLGNKNKDEIKSLAFAKGFESLVNKKESTGVCFLKEENYRDFLVKYSPSKFKNIGKGEVKNKEGKKIGEHDGYPFYTIGQKSGIITNINGEFFVSCIDPVNNALYVDQKSNLFSDQMELINYYFHDIDDINIEGITAVVRGIGINPKGYCKIQIINSNKARVKLDDPAWATAPGQPVVFYIGNRVIGGGIVDCEIKN